MRFISFFCSLWPLCLHEEWFFSLQMFSVALISSTLFHRSAGSSAPWEWGNAIPESELSVTNPVFKSLVSLLNHKLQILFSFALFRDWPWQCWEEYSLCPLFKLDRVSGASYHGVCRQPLGVRRPWVLGLQFIKWWVGMGRLFSFLYTPLTFFPKGKWDPPHHDSSFSFFFFTYLCIWLDQVLVAAWGIF